MVAALFFRWIWCSFFFFSSRRRHTRCLSDWSSDVCSSDLPDRGLAQTVTPRRIGVGRARRLTQTFEKVVIALEVTVAGPVIQGSHQLFSNRRGDRKSVV